MQITIERDFGPYHVDDVKDEVTLSDIRGELEEYISGDGGFEIKFLGAQTPTQQDIDTWNADYEACDPGSEPVCSRQFTRTLRFSWREEV